jgi:hypothetical protein
MIARYTLDGHAEKVEALFRQEGFIRAGHEVPPNAVLDYFGPLLESIATHDFTFSREWLRAQGARLGDPRSAEYKTGRQFNLPPTYLLVHRVSTGTTGVLCQLGSHGDFRAIAERYLPGFAADPPATRATARRKAATPPRKPAKRTAASTDAAPPADAGTPPRKSAKRAAPATRATKAARPAPRER